MMKSKSFPYFIRTIVRWNHFDASHLAKCHANYSQLTPMTFFNRTVSLFPAQPAYEYNDNIVTWGLIKSRISCFAHALVKFGIKHGDVVSIMAPNGPAVFESHFAVPSIGAVLLAINTRLDATTIAYQLAHSEAKIVFVDCEYSNIMKEAVSMLQKSTSKIPVFININDSCTPYGTSQAPLIGETEYEDFLRSGDAGFELPPVRDEWDAISLNYTSGTTGNPKGVVCTHRGAYLNSISNIVEWNMERFPRFLWSK